MQIVRALLVRNHPDVAQHIDRYFSAFSDPQIGRDAAKALGKLGSGGEGILIKANYAVLGVKLYK
jgi:DNA repair/transcription protein MET18/MMS19